MSVHDFYEDYDVPKSEVDELVEDATNKVVELILDRAKEQVDAVMQKAEEQARNRDYWRDLYKEQKKKADEFFEGNKKLQEELDKKRTDIGTLPYSVGQAVYRVSRPCSGEVKVTCATCNGKGRVRGLLGSRPVDATCPDCLNCSSKFDNNKYVREAKYHIWRPQADVISKIHLTFLQDDQKNEVREVNYRIGDTLYRESEISEDINVIKAICEERTLEEKEKALTLVGRTSEVTDNG